LAGKRDPDPGMGGSEELPPAALHCVEAITCPAYILDRTWTARCWNAPAEALFVGWLGKDGERNLLRFIFLRRSARTLICDWEARAQRVAAEFRAACGTHFDDPTLRQLIDALHRDSAEFARFWDQHGVLEREGGARTFNHPEHGFLSYEQVSFNLSSHPDLKLTMLVQSNSAGLHADR
jgi:hypothetical protein